MLTGFSEYAPLYDGLDSDASILDTLSYAVAGYYPNGYVGDSQTYALRDRYSLYRNLNDFDTLTITTLKKYYDEVYEWAGLYQSFDDHAHSANASATRFSSTLDDFSAAVYYRK